MKRPSSVTSLLGLVLSLTAWNLLRLGASMADWNVLAEFAPRPGPAYITTTAAIWAWSGFAVWRWIHRRDLRAQYFIAAYFIGYLLWWWADRLLFQSINSNWPFALGVTLVALGISALELFNRKTTSYFRQRETHEQTSTDPNPA